MGLLNAFINYAGLASAGRNQRIFKLLKCYLASIVANISGNASGSRRTVSLLRTILRAPQSGQGSAVMRLRTAPRADSALR